ncbi:MAG: pyruvate/ketoisovalerate oxidoreductase subunit gamma [Candidatus Bathyarchaeota archaeon B23]|nr:MAG: pyruvate/ketoisovalerate oxidoreductase subunit gamma [Candidatus Bathyarchaeota archaeon B23]
MIEVRFHGRGGQGAWTASLLLAQGGLREGKYVQSFPAFGPERAGAPITSYTRISDAPIDIHSGIYEPDAVVVLDPTLLGPSVVEGLKSGGKIVVNTPNSPEAVRESLGLREVEVWTIDATSLALETLRRPITNTVMLGALIKAEEIVKLNSLFEAVRERFRGEVGELNVKVIETAYREVRRG